MKKHSVSLYISVIVNLISIVFLILKNAGKIAFGNMGVCILLELAFFVWLIFSLLGLWQSKAKTTLLYGFDYNGEKNVYSKVGKKGATYSTYLEWKTHMLEVMDVKVLTDDTKENFYRYLKRKHRSSCDSYNLITVLLIPIMIAVFSSTMAVYTAEKYSETEILITSIMTVAIYAIMFTNEILDAKEKIYFSEDVIEVFFPEKLKDDANSL